MKLPRRTFYQKDLFHPNLYSEHWARTIYVTIAFINKYIEEDARLYTFYKLVLADCDL